MKPQILAEPMEGNMSSFHLKELQTFHKKKRKEINLIVHRRYHRKFLSTVYIMKLQISLGIGFPYHIDTSCCISRYMYNLNYIYTVYIYTYMYTYTYILAHHSGNRKFLPVTSPPRYKTHPLPCCFKLTKRTVHHRNVSYLKTSKAKTYLQH